MKTVYLVMENNDKTEGKGTMIPRFATENRDVAQEIADKLEPYGNSGQFNDVMELTVLESAEAFIAWKNKINDLKEKIHCLTKELRDLER